jgi:hypothetical protein
MRKALRPYVVAGVAVVGAGALAITTPPDVKIVNPGVRHTASAFDVYRDAVEHLLANLEALLGTAVAGPAPPGLSLELALDGLSRASAGEFRSLREPLGRYIVDLPVLSGSRTQSSEVQEAARVDLAAGHIESALDHLLRASVYAVVQGVKLLTVPVGVLLGSIAEPVARLASDFTVAFVDPLTRRVGATTESGGVIALHSDISSAVSLQSDPGRSVTVDVNTGVPPSSVKEGQRTDPAVVSDADDSTNADVMADAEGEHRSDGNPHHPRQSGSNPADERGGGVGLNTLHDGIRDGQQGLRDGVRGAVTSLTGRGDVNAGNTGVNSDESK